MTKQLIINADDFGYYPAASEAIIDLLEHQKITSTTIMANFATDGELTKLAKIPGISTGIHINLNSGKPLSQPGKIKSLLTRDETFFKADVFLWKILTGRISTEEIELEVGNQIENLKNRGINISHADSHQHIHQFPFAGKIILKTLKKHGITKVRNCLPSAWPGTKAKIIRAFSLLTNHLIQKFTTPEGLIPYFSFASEIGMVSFSKAIDEAFVNKSVLELMTHPGVENLSTSHVDRKKEFDFWNNENYQEILKQKGIGLINYHQL